MESPGIINTNQQDKADYLLSEQIALLLEKDQLIGEQATVIERKSEVISAQKQRIAILEEALRLSKIKRFAPSSEQCHQHSLFDEAEVEAEIDNDLAESDAEEVGETAEKKKKTGRKPMSLS